MANLLLFIDSKVGFIDTPDYYKYCMSFMVHNSLGQICCLNREKKELLCICIFIINFVFTYITQQAASSPLLSSPNDIFETVVAGRLFPSIMVSPPPTAGPSQVTNDLIVRSPSERRRQPQMSPWVRGMGEDGGLRDKYRTERKQ